MSEKKRMTTWVPTIVMGVVAILFSVYALQEQTEVQRAKNEVNQLKADLNACQKQIADEKVKSAEYQEAVRIANAAAESARAEAESLKSKKRK